MGENLNDLLDSWRNELMKIHKEDLEKLESLKDELTTLEGYKNALESIPKLNLTESKALVGNELLKSKTAEVTQEILNISQKIKNILDRRALILALNSSAIRASLWK